MDFSHRGHGFPENRKANEVIPRISPVYEIESLPEKGENLVEPKGPLELRNHRGDKEMKEARVHKTEHQRGERCT